MGIGEARRHLELAWVHPDPAPRTPAVAAAHLVLLPPPTLRPSPRGERMDLARAIERQLSGASGLSDGEFLSLFARGVLPGAAS